MTTDDKARDAQDVEELSVKDRTRILLYEAAEMLRYLSAKDPDASGFQLSKSIVAFLVSSEGRSFLGDPYSKPNPDDAKDKQETIKPAPEAIAASVLRCSGEMYRASPYHPVIRIIGNPRSPDRVNWQAAVIMKRSGHDVLVVTGLTSQSIRESIDDLRAAMIEAVDEEKRGMVKRFEELKEMISVKT